MATPVHAQTPTNGAYVIKDDKVIDLRSGVEWLRCSLGQQFDEGDCTGEVLRLTQYEVAEAIRIANRELGGYGACLPAKNLNFWSAKAVLHRKLINLYFQEQFLNLTGQGNGTDFSKKSLVSQFMTGHSYGRFFPYQRLAVRLVRTR